MLNLGISELNYAIGTFTQAGQARQLGSPDLLANDNLGGIPGSNLQITGVSHFRHGTGYLDANGFVHFNPKANYAGTGVGFDAMAVNEGSFLWVA